MTEEFTKKQLKAMASDKMAIPTIAVLAAFALKQMELFETQRELYEKAVERAEKAEKLWNTSVDELVARLDNELTAARKVVEAYRKWQCHPLNKNQLRVKDALREYDTVRPAADKAVGK